MYPSFDEKIKNTIDFFKSSNDDVLVYEIKVSEKSKKDDFIIKITGASDVNEYKVKYSLAEEEIINKSKKMMTNTALDRYALRKPIDLDKVNLSLDDITKILDEKMVDVRLKEWKLTNKNQVPVWKVKYTDKLKNNNEIKLSGINGDLI